jgi:hypothetical protein
MVKNINNKRRKMDPLFNETWLHLPVKQVTIISDTTVNMA